MEQIIKPNSAIMGILGKTKSAVSGYRLIKYCVSAQVEEGTLLFNLLTREMVLLTPEEYACGMESAYLRQHWFVIPEEMDEKKLVGLVRWITGASRKKTEHITHYTVLTTTDCNARCFYCYERGRFRTNMSEETACKTADFIKDHCGGKKAKITWFGGEPLVNFPVIDVICDRLRAAGVEFGSTMISNGYLFDDKIVEKAVNSWKLKSIQITLDGTEEVYNRCKDYIYQEGSAYQVVTANIARLLDAGIVVNVRLNIDFHNAEDLMKLADELARTFAGKKGLRVYAHLIFDEKTPWDQRYTLEEWEQLYQQMHRLDDKLRAYGLAMSSSCGLKRELPSNYCMADNDGAVVIVPDGHLGRCRHYSESEFMGHMDSPERDQAVIASWKERCDELPECNDCFYYPECMNLKKCMDRMACIDPERASIRRRTELSMINEFHHWQGVIPEITEAPERD